MEADWSLHPAGYLPIGLVVRRAVREGSLPSDELKECGSAPRGLSEGQEERELWKLGAQLSGMSLSKVRTVNLGLVVLTVQGPWMSVFKTFILLLRKQLPRGNKIGP